MTSCSQCALHTINCTKEEGCLSPTHSPSRGCSEYQHSRVVLRTRKSSGRLTGLQSQHEAGHSTLRLSQVITGCQSPGSFLSKTRSRRLLSKGLRILRSSHTLSLTTLVPERCLQACQEAGMLLEQAEKEEKEVGSTLRRPPTRAICLFMFLASLSTMKMKD